MSTTPTQDPLGSDQLQQRASGLTITHDELPRPHEWLTQLFEQAPVAIALLEGDEYRIRLANESMYAIWQLPPNHDPVLNRPVFEAFPNIAGLGLEALLDQIRQTGIAVKGNEQPAIFVRNGQPETVYINFVYSPIRMVAGQIDVMVVAHDVTEQVNARQKLVESNQIIEATNTKLIEANNNLVRSNENLEKFAYIASHDLQEPLRKIQQFSGLLQEQYSQLLGDGEQYLQRIQAAAGRMSTLIKDLLTYSRISSRPQGTPDVVLSELIGNVLIDLDLVIQETGAQLDIQPLPTLPGDPAQLGQLFQNLLSNALKFRQPGTTPLVRINAQRVLGKELPDSVHPPKVAESYYQIDVADNGIGFDEKYKDEIFQVFRRLHSASQYPGTGIGLAICEKVVANHGGTISVSSQAGKGTTFHIYLPAN